MMLALLIFGLVEAKVTKLQLCAYSTTDCQGEPTMCVDHDESIRKQFVKCEFETVTHAASEANGGDDKATKWMTIGNELLNPSFSTNGFAVNECVNGHINFCEDDGKDTQDGWKCFDGDAIVDTPSGAARVWDLKKGDLVKDSAGDFSKVVGFLHRGKNAKMLELVTEIGSMRLSGGHLVETTMGLYQAKDVTVGMSLLADRPAKVVEIRSYTAKNFVAPLTQSGSIQVDGFKASCYAHIPASLNWLANVLFWPQRYFLTTEVKEYAAILRAGFSAFPGLNKLMA